MKKLLYILFTMFFSFNLVFANETDELTKMLNFGNMPTDEEIMQTINKFNFDEKQKEYLFQETKKQLQLMYQNNDVSKMLENIDPKTLEGFTQAFEERSLNLPEVAPSTEAQKEKKYSGHEPVFKKRKYGPNRSQ